MSALPIIITTAGLNALVNAQNTGASNVVIASLGVSPTQIAATAATAAIPGEVKRIAGVSGQVVADDQIYISAGDQTEDTYTVRTIGLYLNTGVLFGVYSQAAPLLEKAAPAMAVLEAAIKLSAPQANVIEFTGGGWLNPQASETVQGVLKLAPVDEAVLGADHSKAVTPKGLKAATSAMMAAIQATFDQIAQTLAGKANTVHQHAAGDVTSGAFSEARIPSLPQSRITGLIDALASKAAAVHGHAMSEIAGLAAALALKASLGANVGFGDVRVTRGGRVGVLYFGDGDDFILLSNGDLATNRPFNSPALTSGGNAVWHAANFNPATKASLNDVVTFSDVRAFRGNGTGVVYLGDLSHYVFYDGVNYNMPGAPLIVNGGVVWTSATFDPASRVSKSGDTMTGPLRMTEVRLKAPNTGKTGSYASVFSKYYGDDNYGVGFAGWRGDAGVGTWAEVGSVDQLGRGWLNGYRIWTAELFDPAVKADRDSPDFVGAVRLPANTLFKKEVANSSEGGQLVLERADQSTSLAQDVVVDINGDSLRIWERGGAFRGAHLNIAQQLGGVGSVIWTSSSLKFAGGGVVTDPNAGPNTHDQMISPAALWAFARNMGSPGYAVIPGTGLMIQWGLTTANMAEGETHAYLPVAFGGGCLVALANPRNPNRNINTDFYMQVVGHFADRIAFFANRANGSSGNLDGYEWIALGRVSGAADPAYSSGSSGGTGGGGGGGGQVEV